jgi:hypothetical protein
MKRIAQIAVGRGEAGMLLEALALYQADCQTKMAAARLRGTEQVPGEMAGWAMAGAEAAAVRDRLNKLCVTEGWV